MKNGPKKIGLMLNDANSDYVKEIIDGVSSVCEQKEAPLFVFSVGELDVTYRPFDFHQKTLACLCNIRNIDGLVICSAVLGHHTPKEKLESFVRSFSDIPMVSVGAKFHGIPSIVCDAKSGIESVLDDFVVNHRRKKFCLLGDLPGSVEAVERAKIVSEYLDSKGLRFDERSVIGGNFTYESAMSFLEEYWEEKDSFDFDAVFALNDDMAFAAIDFCAKHKIQVPEKVCVAGFDDVARAAFSRPTLTTVNQQLFEQGETAAKILFDLLNKKKAPAVIPVQSSARFRKSCPCAHGGKPLVGALPAAAAQNTGDLPAAEWLGKKTQFHLLFNFLSMGQNRLNLAKLRRNFKEFAERFDLSAAALCVYDEPVLVKESDQGYSIPSKAYVLASYDDERHFVQNINEEPPCFDPRDKMLPDGIMGYDRGQYVLWVLSNCETQYGYMVFRKGACENLIYSMMCVEFSRLTNSAWESSRAEKIAKAQQERTARLNMISNTDELTGLLNRRGFMEMGQQTMDIALLLKQGGMVIFGDMDGLKGINDNFGHDAGDRAIKAEAEILKNNFRASDIVGRLGGDEFVIVAAGLTEPRLAEIRKSIDAACQAWNIVNNEGFELSISLGCKKISSDQASLEEILKEADSLLYEEKRRKHNARR